MSAKVILLFLKIRRPPVWSPHKCDMTYSWKVDMAGILLTGYLLSPSKLQTCLLVNTPLGFTRKIEGSAKCPDIVSDSTPPWICLERGLHFCQLSETNFSRETSFCLDPILQYAELADLINRVSLPNKPYLSRTGPSHFVFSNWSWR